MSADMLLAVGETMGAGIVRKHKRALSAPDRTELTQTTPVPSPHGQAWPPLGALPSAVAIAASVASLGPGSAHRDRGRHWAIVRTSDYLASAGQGWPGEFGSR